MFLGLKYDNTLCSDLVLSSSGFHFCCEIAHCQSPLPSQVEFVMAKQKPNLAQDGIHKF